MPVTIRVKPSGPYVIALDQVNEVLVVDGEGHVLTPEPGRPIKLCRCGSSSRKPFCDGTHRSTTFDCSADIPSASPSQTHQP